MKFLLMYATIILYIIYRGGVALLGENSIVTAVSCIATVMSLGFQPLFAYFKSESITHSSGYSKWGLFDQYRYVGVGTDSYAMLLNLNFYVSVLLEIGAVLSSLLIVFGNVFDLLGGLTLFYGIAPSIVNGIFSLVAIHSTVKQLKDDEIPLPTRCCYLIRLLTAIVLTVACMCLVYEIDAADSVLTTWTGVLWYTAAIFVFLIIIAYCLFSSAATSYAELRRRTIFKLSTNRRDCIQFIMSTGEVVELKEDRPYPRMLQSGGLELYRRGEEPEIVEGTIKEIVVNGKSIEF